MKFNTLTIGEFYKYKDIEFEGLLVRILESLKYVPPDEWSDEDSPDLTWNFKVVDMMIRDLFLVYDFSDSDEYESPVPSYRYFCRTDKSWGRLEGYSFEIAFYKSRKSMSFDRIPVILMAKFIDQYNLNFPDDKPMIAVSDISANYIFIDDEMTSTEFYEEISSILD